jgi:integral membrane sensor domain MASE1
VGFAVGGAIGGFAVGAAVGAVRSATLHTPYENFSVIRFIASLTLSRLLNAEIRK